VPLLTDDQVDHVSEWMADKGYCYPECPNTEDAIECSDCWAEHLYVAIQPRPEVARDEVWGPSPIERLMRMQRELVG
jgi:hypothetical protein